MADRATGPVKPPVIDLTARTQRTESEAKAPTPPPDPQRPRFDLAEVNWPLLGGVAVAGAVLGTILTYIVATALPLPSRAPALPPDLTPQLVAEASRLDALEGKITMLNGATTKTQVSLDATIAQLDSGLTAANKAVADLKAAIPPAQAAVDLSPLETEIKTLKAEMDVIAAGAPGTDANTIAQNLASLQTGVSSLTTRLNGVDSTLSALRTDLDATRKTLVDHINAALPNEVGPALKLPLILSGLESAFANGKPFDSELRSLTSVLPDFTVSADLASTASTGLSRPDALMQSFEAVLPDVLAARAPGNGDWVQGATDWVKGMLALRPAEEQTGDAPEAIVSRVEGAMGRRDYATARALLGQLPAPMQAAAGPVAGEIAAHADADKLVTDLRARALNAAEATP
jgi:hypothetical protein